MAVFLSFGQSVGWSVCHNLLKGQQNNNNNNNNKKIMIMMIIMLTMAYVKGRAEDCRIPWAVTFLIFLSTR